MDKSFLPELFKRSTTQVPLQGIILLPVKQVGLEILNLNLSAWDNWTSSCVVMVNLVTAIHGRTYFKLVDQSIILQEFQGEIRRRHVQDSKTELKEDMEESPHIGCL